MSLRRTGGVVVLLFVAQVVVGTESSAAAGHDSRPSERVANRASIDAPGSRLWVDRAQGGEGDGLAVDPTRDVVYVTGLAQGGCTTIAYAGSSGQRLWRAVLAEPGEGDAIAVSPNGDSVFVTAEADGRAGAGQNFEFVTIAYDASTGKKAWVARYNGPFRNGLDLPSDIVVSPGGGKVFVTGRSEGRGGDEDYATVAYAAATGKRLWAARYDGPVHEADHALALAVTPTGKRVFVTGESTGANASSTRYDWATVAYGASGGRRAWVARYNGPGHGDDGATAVGVSPGGSTVFVTGGEWAGTKRASDYATIAYRASGGARRWLAQYNGPGSKNDFASALAVAPSGKKVFITGFSEGKHRTAAFGTVAYGAAGGRKRWVARYTGPAGLSAATGVTVRPDGSQVYVTGPSRGTEKPVFPNPADYATAAYRSSTGAKLWVSRFGRAGYRNVPVAIGVNAAGTHVFVTGMSQPDFTTVAYAAS